MRARIGFAGVIKNSGKSSRRCPTSCTPIQSNGLFIVQVSNNRKESQSSYGSMISSNAVRLHSTTLAWPSFITEALTERLYLSRQMAHTGVTVDAQATLFAHHLAYRNVLRAG